MVIYYTTEKTESGEFLKKVLKRHGVTSQVLYTPNGKPYLAAGIKFSLADTDGLIAVAVGGQEVGLDAERRRPRNIAAVLSRLTPAEKEEDFFELWTAKEAYVKYLGGTLARLLPLLEYKKGVLYCKDAPADVFLNHIDLEGCTVCVCTAEAENISLKKL